MKKILLVLSSILALLFLSVLIIPNFIDTSSYRAAILSMLEEKTGYRVSLNGELSLSILPSASLSAENIIISSAETPDDALVNVKVAKISVDLWSLLEGNISISSIDLKSPNVLLRKNADGSNNWKSGKIKTSGLTGNIIDPIIVLSSFDAIASNKESATSKESANYKLSINSIDVTSAKITYIDESTNQIIVLNNASFDSSRSEDIFPFSLKGKLSGTGLPENNINIQGDLNINDKQYKISNLDFIYKTVTEGYGEVNINLSQEMPYVASAINLEFFNANSLSHNEEDLSVNMDWLISSANAQVSKSKPRKKIERWSSKKISLNSLSSLNAKINLEAKKVEFGDIALGPLSLHAYLNHGYLQAKLKKLKFADGNITGETIVNIAGDTPKYKQSLYFTGVQMDAVSPNHDISRKLKGVLNGEIDVTSRGDSIKYIIGNLNGKASFVATDGEIKSVDVLSMIKNVQSAFSNHSTSIKTVFDKVSASFDIKKGVLQNDDAVLYSKWMRVTGKGYVDLPNWILNYKVTPDDSEGTELAKFNKSSIPIVPVYIRGSIDSPKFIPDLKALANKIIKNNKSVNKALEGITEQLNKKLGNDNGKLIQKDVIKGLENVFGF